MIGLEKNRVFDTTKLDSLRSTGTALLSAGEEVCTELDAAAEGLRGLESLVPSGIKSSTLSSALSSVQTPYSNTEYESIRLKLDHTLLKLAGNMPTCDTDAAAVVTLTTAITNQCSVMIEELQQSVNIETISLSLKEYQEKIESYKAMWEEREEMLEEWAEQAETILKGLPEYTSFEGDPVNMETGNFVYRYVDMETGRMNPFCFARFYNAMDRNKGALGRGWIHNWEIQLKVQENVLTLVWEDGREENFTKSKIMEKTVLNNSKNTYQSQQDKKNILCETEDYFYIANGEKAVYAFDKEGRFVRLEKDEGKGVSLFYEEGYLTQVKEDTGMAFYLTYNEKGQLTKVKDETGRIVHYAYNGKKLVEVIDPMGKSTSYAYAKNGKMLQLLDKREISILTNEYDDDKRILSQRFPDGGIMKFEYLKQKRVCVTERNGSKIYYKHDKKHRKTETVYADGKESWCYDENNNCREYTDKRGNKTRYDYNEAGQIVCVTDALLSKTMTEYDEAERPIKQIRPDGGVITWRYDKEGRLIEKTNPENSKVCFCYQGEERSPSVIILPDGSQCNIRYDVKGNIEAVEYSDGISMTYEYDALDRVVESRDGNGNSTRFAYDAMNRMTKVMRADGKCRDYRYNDMGEVLEIKDFDGYSANWEYNVLNKPEVYIDKCGRKTQMEYDSMWNLSKVTDPEGGVTEYCYNALNHLESVKRSGENSVLFSYDANGNRTKIQYPDGTEKNYEYDQLNRRTAEIDENGNITRTFYDCMGNIIRIEDALGNTVVYEYDKNGRKIKETDTDGAITHYTYTVLGKPETITDPVGKVTRYHYSSGGRLVKLEKGDGTWEDYKYDRAGNVTTRRYQDGQEIDYKYDCLNRVTEVRCNDVCQKVYEYDAMGRVTAVTDAHGGRTEYQYSPEGKLTKVTAPLGSCIHYSYNGRDELLSICRISAEEREYLDKDLTDISSLNEMGISYQLTLFIRDDAGRTKQIVGENGKSMYYQYDVMGRPVSLTDEEGRETIIDYYPGGRVKEASYPDGRSVVYTYDALYHLAGIRDWLGEMVFAYDRMGRMTKSTDHRGASTEYGYYPDGSKAWMLYPDGKKVEYHYDEYGRACELISGQFKINYTYNEKGYLSSVKRGNGIESLYQYDQWGRPEKVIHQGAEGVLEAFTYQYDMLGNCIAADRESSEHGYSYQNRYCYDALNRLTDVYEGDALLRSYAYDAYGNRIEEEKNIQAEDAWTPEFGYRGELTALYKDECPVQINTYNGLGYRVSQLGSTTTEKQRYMDYTDKYRRVIMESGERIRHYLWQNNELLGMAEEAQYVLTDMHHTPIRVMGRSGESLNCYDYDEFGVPIKNREEISLPFGHTGYVKEEVPGLYHANAREYESQSGRFLTRDHYRYMDYADPVSLNLYQYAKSNPLRYVDYDGHVCIEEPSYMERTWNCVVMGSYSDDVTVLGIIINVLLGLAGVDILADLRDLSADLTVNFAPQELSWWATTLIDVAALFPVIGALKHLDEVGVAVKGAVKSLDDMLSGVKYTDSMLEGIGEAIKTCRKNSEELLKKAQEALEASKKKLSDVKNAGEELVESGKKTVDVNGKSVTMDNSTFDPNFVDKQGRTNVQRMEQGLAPIGTDGKSVNIHHIDQTNNGPVMEITATEHQQNYSKLHTNIGQSPSQINRTEFNSWRKGYWEWRSHNLD